jgi:hypothetical protein
VAQNAEEPSAVLPHKQVLDPAASQLVAPALSATRNPRVWVYRYTEPARGWTLSIATHGEPGSGQLSLGGFRIAPGYRTDRAGYDNDREAIELAIGMEEKIYWSRLLRVGGPLLLSHPTALVGGKCVLAPTADARVGQPNDAALLDFALDCFRDFEATSGVLLATGQDLGHGTLSDGVTGSLAYVHARFRGGMLADTSKPTAEGNYQALQGMLRGVGIAMDAARIGLVGCGNIGEHVLSRVRERGGDAVVLEASPATRASLESRGVRVCAPEQKHDFLREPLDAIVVNASGGSLDRQAVALICANPRVRVVCGSENLAMPDPASAEVLRQAGKLYCPTELGGMMGYLTAVEEYLAERDEVPFDVQTLFDAAQSLERAAFDAARLALREEPRPAFEDAMRSVFGERVP